MQVSQFGPASFALSRPVTSTGLGTLSGGTQTLSQTLPQTQDRVSLGDSSTPTDPMKALVSKFGKASGSWMTESSGGRAVANKPSVSSGNPASPGTYTNKYGEELPLPKGFGMSAQDIIAHNKTVTDVKDMIKPLDRSGESVLAYNTRLEELKASSGTPPKHQFQTESWRTSGQGAKPTGEAGGHNHHFETGSWRSSAQGGSKPPDQGTQQTAEPVVRKHQFQTGSWRSSGSQQTGGMGTKRHNFQTESWRTSPGKLESASSQASETPGTFISRNGETLPLPKSFGKSNEEIIAHNKSATKVSELIVPLDRSADSVLAYNERIEELNNAE